MLSDFLSLKDKIAIVTGAGSGLGRAIALLYGQAGAKLVLAGRKPDPLAETAAMLDKAGATSLVVPTDVRDENAVKALVDAASDTFGRIDIVVNNAGGNGNSTHTIDKLPIDRWDRVVSLNMRSPFLMTQAAGQKMIASGGGVFVNISSEAGVHGVHGASAYNTAKSGLQMLTRSTAAEWGKHNIRANAIAPGFIPTEGSLLSLEKGGMNIDGMREIIPLRRFGTSDDVARLALFLAGPSSSFISGEIIEVNGGPFMRGEQN